MVSLCVCVDISPLGGRGCCFPSAHRLLPRSSTDGFTVLLVTYLFGDCITGELESDNYFKVQTCSASLIGGTGWVAV